MRREYFWALVGGVIVFVLIMLFEVVSAHTALLQLEAAQALLGMVSGVIVVCWIGPLVYDQKNKVQQNQPYPTFTKWWESRNAGYGIALGGLLLASIMLPYFDRITAIKTPLGEIIFGSLTSESNQFIFRIEKERDLNLSLGHAKGLADRAVMDNVFIDNFFPKSTDKELNRRLNFLTSNRKLIEFVKENLSPLFDCITESSNQYLLKNTNILNIEELINEVRYLSENIFGNKKKNKEDIIKLIAEMHKDLKNRLVDRKSCKKIPNIDNSEHLDFSVLSGGPNYYILISLMMKFTGDVEGAASLLKANYDNYKDFINYNFFLAELMRISNQDARDYIYFYETALSVADKRHNELLKFQAKNGDSKNLTQFGENISLENMLERYRSAKLHLQNSIAYYATRANLFPEKAKQYIGVIQSEMNANPSRWAGANAQVRANFLDTVGYIRMAAAVRRSKPDRAKLLSSQGLFMEALTILDKLIGLEKFPRQKQFLEANRSIVNAHSRQADQLLRQISRRN